MKPLNDQKNTNATLFFYLLGVDFMDRCVGEAEVVEETHLLV